MPMSINAVKKAERLIQERSSIVAAKWNAVCIVNSSGDVVTTLQRGPFRGADTMKADEELAWAIEEFRRRKLDAIDAKLCELGVDPTAEDEE